MFKNKKKNKTFKNNEEYFAWFDKTKEEIEIVEFKITDDKIKLSYEERDEENE